MKAVKCGETCSVCVEEGPKVIGGRIELVIDGHFVYSMTGMSPEAFGAWWWDFFQNVPQNNATLVQLKYCKPVYGFPNP